MGTVGGYFRLLIGMMLSLEIIRMALFGSSGLGTAIALSLVFLASTAAFVIRKFYGA